MVYNDIHLKCYFKYYMFKVNRLYKGEKSVRILMISYQAKIKSHKLNSFFDPDEEEEELSKEE